MTITPEAIETAARALYALAPTYAYSTPTGLHSVRVPWERVSPDNQGNIRSMATTALSAAAPLIADAAWDEGHDAGWGDADLDATNGGAKKTPNPYRTATK
jgi:hypothetical protein